MWNQIVLLFFHSLTVCSKASFLLGCGKQWVNFPAVTGYFVKMNSLPIKPPTDYLCTIERFITVQYGRTSKHIHEHRHGWITFVYQKGLFDEMTALTKVALYQHILNVAYQSSCVWVSARTGKIIARSSKLWWIKLDTTLCVCSGNFEHYMSVNWWLFLKLVMLNNWKSLEKTVSYQITYRLWHLLPALLVNCHFENVYVCI